MFSKLVLSTQLFLSLADVNNDNLFSAGEPVEHRFQKYLSATGKAYPDDETFGWRLKIFTENEAFIESFNRERASSGLQLGLNQFADLSRFEFKQKYLSGLLKSQTTSSLVVPYAGVNVETNMPESVDWRKKGAVTPVKDQKTCGSCWAFSATGAIEGAWYIAHGSQVILSEEELVDCSGGKNHGCSGGDPHAAFDWVVKNGICSNASYPYTAYQDECHNQFNPCQVTAHIAGYKLVQSMDELALQSAVVQQPISVEIEADTDAFRFYKSGVFSNSGCGQALDHAVLLVGYGTQDGQKYWIVKNSWNAAWGENGYIRLARTNSSASAGECGIALAPSYPVVQATVVV